MLANYVLIAYPQTTNNVPTVISTNLLWHSCFGDLGKRQKSRHLKILFCI